jgi:hypothetical protein
MKEENLSHFWLSFAEIWNSRNSEGLFLVISKQELFCKSDLNLFTRTFLNVLVRNDIWLFYSAFV